MKKRMNNDAALSMVLPGDVRAALEGVALRLHVTTSEAARRAIKHGLLELQREVECVERMRGE